MPALLWALLLAPLSAAGETPRDGAGKAEPVHGALDKEVIRRVIQRHLDEVRFCYEASLVDHPDLKGRVMMQFTIAASGKVVASEVQSSTVNDARAEKCIAASLLRWEFPKPIGGGIVIVSYPFVLKLGQDDGKIISSVEAALDLYGANFSGEVAPLALLDAGAAPRARRQIAGGDHERDAHIAVSARYDNGDGGGAVTLDIVAHTAKIARVSDVHQWEIALKRAGAHDASALLSLDGGRLVAGGGPDDDPALLPLNALLRLLVVPFPVAPIGVGASWDADSLFDGAVPVKTRHHYQLVSLNGDKGHVKVTIRQEPATAASGKPTPKFHATGEAEIDFDLQRLMPERVRAKLDFHVEDATRKGGGHVDYQLEGI